MKLLQILGLAAVCSAVPQRFAPRTSRQNSYLAPPAPADDVGISYLAPADASDDSFEVAAPIDNYGAASSNFPVSAPSDGYGAAEATAPVDIYSGAASELEYDDYDPSDIPPDQAAPQTYNNDPPADDGTDMGLKMLMNAVPGTPGVDYPIYSETPETGFTCDGQVNGGYYADPAAECQVFHICTADGQGGLTKYSFLCPNGTIFNQNYFICDWWFNFDCAEAETLAVEKNNELAAARDAASEGATGSASDISNSYASPSDSAGVGYNSPDQPLDDLASYNR